jgi:hypothetical protein
VCRRRRAGWCAGPWMSVYALGLSAESAHWQRLEGLGPFENKPCILQALKIMQLTISFVSLLLSLLLFKVFLVEKLILLIELIISVMLGS